MRSAAPILLALSVAVRAAAQQPAPTPATERVVVPSLPDQPNKEGVVQPSGAMKTDEAGYVRNAGAPVEPRTPVPAGAAGAAPVAPGPGIGVPATLPTPASAPRGETVVGAAYLSLRGVLIALEKGVSVTVRETNGRTRTVPLAAHAFVAKQLRTGDGVTVRIPLRKPANGKAADRVEKQKPLQAPPKSKFSAAQSPH